MTLPTPRRTRRSYDTFHMSRYSLPDDLIGALVWLLSDASGFGPAWWCRWTGVFLLTRFSERGL